MAEAPPPPARPASEPSSSTTVPRGLPLTLLLPPPSKGNRGAGGGNGRAAAGRAVGSGERGRKKGRAPDSSAGEGAHGDRLVEAVRVVGRDVDAGVAGADILELAMAKGPMFSWLSY